MICLLQLQFNFMFICLWGKLSELQSLQIPSYWDETSAAAESTRNTRSAVWLALVAVEAVLDCCFKMTGSRGGRGLTVNFLSPGERCQIVAVVLTVGPQQGRYQSCDFLVCVCVCFSITWFPHSTSSWSRKWGDGAGIDQLTVYK